MSNFKITPIVGNTQAQKEALTINCKRQARKQGVILHPKAEQILQASFVGCLLGAPGSGKSTMLQQMLLNGQFYGQKFQRVLFIGGPDSRVLVQDEFNKRKNIQLQWIYQHINAAKKWKCQNMLLVFDDVISQMKSLVKNHKFYDLFFNRRHLLEGGTISIIIIVQKWNLVPTFIRQSYTFVLAFPLTKPQTGQLLRDVSINHSSTVLINLLLALKQHQFIYINISKGKAYNSKWTQI